MFKQVTIIGAGLIGSSIARAAREIKGLDTLVGFDQNQQAAARLQDLNLFDWLAPSLEEAVKDADLTIICTPIGAFQQVATRIAPHLKAGSILSDVGSCKLSMLERIAPLLPAGVMCIPAHPIAGTEHSGPDAGFAELFQDRYCILTPPADADQRAVQKLAAFWEAMGSRIEIMDAAHHDRVLAITSHLPHAIAYALVRTAADLEDQLKAEKVGDQALIHSGEVMKFSAGGFRDFTRIANSNPIMWRDVFLENKAPVLEMLGRFTEDLIKLQRLIRFGDGKALEKWFYETKSIRSGIEALNQGGTFIPTEKKTNEKSDES
ncbi:MAG: prephenate dehydrogenase/arogenate dehydrogenase family protein [Alphaproteobacteria bacterium]